MAWTKPSFYMSLLLVVIVFFVAIDNAGTGLVNKDRISLDERSLDYINNIKGQNSDNGFESIKDTEVSSSQGTDILGSENGTQVNTENDYLSTVFIKQEKASSPTNYFKLVYNLPSSIIMGLGLDVADWSDFINILIYALVIALIVLVWTRLINV